ncbi:MAG: dihydropteroate synthase [Candidatus Omnitrophica bacterium]|nr:dihydropteroate synthase [Candidatus Omnitrophota bacterium]
MKNLEFGSRTYIMGILNLTPDSFSGDGIYGDVDRALREAERIVQEGADIIDVGGESTRPGALPVGEVEEINRVIPVIKALANKVNIPISIDTRKSEVAQRALDNGASIINDITGLESDRRMAQVAACYNAKVIIMHIKGTPQTMQRDPKYYSLTTEIIEKLNSLIQRAEQNGVKKENIIVDPGIGFGKTFEHNLEILNNLSHFKVLKKPILVGPSRKSFIGNILGSEPRERLFGTAACTAIAIKNGADIIRVHDVKEIKEVIKVTDAIVRSGETVNA